MALARIYTALNSLIIRKLGDTGGASSTRVDEELNSLIAWVRSSPRNIKRDFAKVDSTAGGPDVLHTFTLDTPFRLTADGDYLNVWYGGNFAANDRDKTVQAQFDNQDYIAGGAVDLDQVVGWNIGARIIRVDSTHVRTSSFRIMNSTAVDSAGVANSFTEGGFVQGRNQDLTVANLNSNAITMRVRSVVGGAAAAADVYQNMSIIELVQQ